MKKIRLDKFLRSTCVKRDGLLCVLLLLTGWAGAAPTVNGLFYGDGDYLKYPSTPYAESEGGSKLYVSLQANNVLYVALVVNRLVNDNVFSPKSDTALTESAGWTQHRALTRLIDSEFAAFSMTVGDGKNEQTWNWQQGTSGLPGVQPRKILGENTYTNWISDETVAGGLGTPPPGIDSASSIQWNLNNYAEHLNAGDPLPWDMGPGGTENWYSPYSSSNPRHRRWPRRLSSQRTNHL